MGKREKERIFRMKQFNVHHNASANKVGVDGVLVGAWTNVGDSKSILDAGTGCGLIALMLAQRAPKAVILAIDLDSHAVEEAKLNVSMSPWNDRIMVEQCDFNCIEDRFDLIVSNPPFFHSGIDSKASDSSRILARHSGSLSPENLLLRAGDLLNPGGRLSFIAQAESEKSLLEIASANHLRPIRICRVKGNPTAPFKRVLMEIQKSENINGEILPEITELEIESEPNVFTPEYTHLCRPYYIKIPD